MSEAPTPTPCPQCLKPQALCVCASVTPIDNRICLLVLQHPQEQDVELGTARLAVCHLENAVFKVGLSWPSLSKVLGRPADPKKWAVLYLGSAKVPATPGEVVALDRKGNPAADQAKAFEGLEGVVVLDGTWSQAKAIWWRNAWLLKCKRVALNPKQPSLYGRLRKEPRRDGLSTIEAAALLLSYLENKPEIRTAMLDGFARMLAAFRTNRA
ncbi:MAG: DTW domain-containing protein [Rhodospirillaceae bacterium]|nr:DTW domain-containing protein [Rhodospirillaceae bacterium]